MTTITITINSRKLSRSITFAIRGQYVYVNRTSGGFCDQQVFNSDGSAAYAKDESDLRKIAKRYIVSRING